MLQEQTKSLNSFPNLQALCKKDEKQKQSLEKLLQHKPHVVKSLDIYAQNIEEYLKDQRKRIAYLKKREEPYYEQKPIQAYDEALIMQYNRVKAKQHYLQQSQKKISQQPSPEQPRNRTPSKYFDKNYNPLKRNEKFDIPSLQPVNVSPPKELKPIQFRYNYAMQINDPLLRQVLSTRQQWFEVPNNSFAHLQWLTQLLDFSNLSKQDVVSKRQMVNLMEFQHEWSAKSQLYNNLCSISPEHALKVLPPGFVLNFKISQWVEDLEFIQDYLITHHSQKETQQKFPFSVYVPNKGGQTYNKQISKLIQDVPKIWICKSAIGSGATILNSVDQLHQFLIQQYKDQKEYVIQKYITNPLLYDGKKFDIQINVLVNQDNQIFVSAEPTGRCCTVNYDPNSEDPFAHTKPKQAISHKGLVEFLDSQGISLQDLLTQIKTSISLIPCKLNRRQRKYCMQIFGFDYLLDDTKKIHLIGINANPIYTYAELDGAFKLTLDKIFPINNNYKSDEKSIWTCLF
ncbi:unnamed protein product (macronuclear) [Paramecium tetraurelia]|uniref:Tubulin-tyrosine ligase family protein n=1 Tax=Paramecium tetraurelia TaxID=5888 RepID=A0BSF5_PARTE|nr:uncharacterized protein GSPATT00031704001 [Paramecium tetraurelia]CAK61472.1 unnamed protein product [Paramecium tetraurelia]|eukprot:XP_001428870.1 hypothetical protein (macronuclear) [Paramecium tetraurelia strain d4-2]